MQLFYRILAPPKWSTWTPWAGIELGGQKCGTMLRYRQQENCNSNKKKNKECLKQNQGRYIPCKYLVLTVAVLANLINVEKGNPYFHLRTLREKSETIIDQLRNAATEVYFKMIKVQSAKLPQNYDFAKIISPLS